MLRALFALMATTALLTGCGVRDQPYNPLHFALQGALVPPEIVATKATGLYPIPASESGMALCCWIGKSADLLVKRHGTARHLSITFYVPGVPAFAPGRQSLLVYFTGQSHGTRFANLSPGFETKSVAVPIALTTRPGDLPVHLRANLDYSPTATSSGPRYALILTSLYLE